MPSPKIPRRKLAAALADRSAQASNIAELATETAAYLLEAGRSAELNSLMRDIMQYRADHGIVEVVAVSAFPLTDAVAADVRQQVKALYPEARQIIMSGRIDTSVVAGIKLEFANQQLDLSVRNKLNRLKQLTSAGSTERNAHA